MSRSHQSKPFYALYHRQTSIKILCHFLAIKNQHQIIRNLQKFTKPTKLTRFVFLKLNHPNLTPTFYEDHRKVS